MGCRSVQTSILFTLWASGVAAQSVELRLRDESRVVAIGGAIVRLLGETGPVAQGLTDEVGRLVLRAPRPGTYRLRIDRIGWSGITTEPFTVESGRPLQLLVPMPSRRVQLPTIEVRGKTRCDGGSSRSELATALWEEVQKALTANLITEAQQLVPLHLREFVRDVDFKGRPLREWVVVSRVVRGPPFASLSPAALSTTGFAYESGDSAVFAAPDAALLLSEEFVQTHCFFALQGAGPLVGLTFQPLSGRRVPDVAGTLWVERESSALRYLDYSYTGLPSALRPRELGGRVQFTQLPTGSWIISYWHIRMPRIESHALDAQHVRPQAAELKGYMDRGGRAEIAGDTLGLVHRAILTGRVYDSLAGQGLPGALVWVQGSSDSMPTDSDGRFEMAIDAAGDRVVSVRHPKLGLLGESTRRQVLLSLGDTAKVEFGVPSLAAIVRATCQKNQRGRVSIVGTARRADGSSAMDLDIRIMKRTSRGNVAIPDTRLAHSTRTGLYGVCNVPATDTVQLIMAFGKKTVVETPVALLGASRWIELRAWGSRDSAAAGFVSVLALTKSTEESSDSLDPPVVVGSVYDSTTGTPIAGAVVRMHSQSDSVMTDTQGRFLLPLSVSGWQVIVVSHPSLGELRGATTQSVTLSAGDTVTVSFPVIPVQAVGARLCGASTGHAGILGITLGPSGRAEPGLPVRVNWSSNRRHELLTRSGAGGLFAFCDLPADLIGGSTLSLELLDSAGRMTQQVTTELAAHELRWIELGSPLSPHR